MTSIKISIITPVYNEGKNIHLLYEKLKQVIAQKYTYEIIFVDDGSTDNSLDIIQALINTDSNVKAVSLTRNFGQQAALTAGLDIANGEAIITLDCDLQDPPELLPQMLALWEKGAKIVYAKRKKRHENFLKKQAAKIYYSIMSKLSKQQLIENIGDFRLIDKTVHTQLSGMREKTRYLRGMISWLGYKYDIINFDRPNRQHGKSGYTIRKMIRLAMSGMLNFSLLPLRIGLVLGTIVILTGLFFLTYITIDTLFFDKYYPLYKWISVTNYIFIGLLFILIWILGEYIGKIYEETKQRPIYIIDKKINIDK